MRRLALTLVLLAGCARTAGTTRARAHAGSDARVLAGEPAGFSGTCEGCQGAPHFRWSFAVAPPDGCCSLQGADGAQLQARCAAPGTWVVRLDVSDAHGPGIADYANLLVSAPPPDAGEPDAGPGDAGQPDAGPGDAGELDAGPTDAGLLDAGLLDAGPADAGPIDAGPIDAGPVDAGPLTGTLTVTFPDGSPAVDVIPGDLLELHAVPSNAFATCTFDAAPAGAQYLASTSLCDTAIVLLAPASGVTFGVTFDLLGQTARASSPAVTAHAATHVSSSTFAADTVAVDPVTQQVIESRPGHAVFLYTPGQSPGFWNGTSDGVATAGGTVREVCWAGGWLGRVLPDGGRLSTGTNAGDFLSCAEAPGHDSAYHPVLAATDGSELVAWGESGSPAEDTGISVDQLVNVEDPAGAGDVSAGVLTLTGGDTLSFIDWASLHDFALNGTTASPQPVTTALTGLTGAVTGPWNNGTLWLADNQGRLWQYQGTLLTGSYAPTAPSQQLSGASPVNAMALEHAPPYAQDLWLAANGGVERVTAAPNSVGAPPTVLRLDVGLGTVTVSGVAAGQLNGTHVIYFATSNGLYALAP